jgi:hypothetical protein
MRVCSGVQTCGAALHLRAGTGRRPSSDEGACPGFRFVCVCVVCFCEPLCRFPPLLDRPLTMQHGSRSRSRSRSRSWLIRVVGLINPTAALVSVCSAASCRGCKGWSQTTACKMLCAPLGACARHGLRTVDYTVGSRFMPGRRTRSMSLSSLICSYLRRHREWQRQRAVKSSQPSPVSQVQAKSSRR